MSLAASYVSATSFTVSDDKTTDFVPGRAVRMDCGVDGIKYGYVTSSSYSSPNTTVTLNSAESQSATSGLTSVTFSEVAFQETGGNLPMQLVWMQRGFKTGLTLSWKDADEIYVDTGALHIDNDSAENIYGATSQITKQLTSLSASTWYVIYIDPPDSGLALVAADIEYSTTMPTYSQAKRGWYHGTNTDWRCIGFVRTDASSNLLQFAQVNKEVRFNTYFFDANAITPNTTWTDVTMTIPMGGMLAIARIAGTYSNGAATFKVRTNGNADGGMEIQYVESTCKHGNGWVSVMTDASKIIETCWNASASTNPIYVLTYGFVLPDGM